MKTILTVKNTRSAEGYTSTCKQFSKVYGFGQTIEDAQKDLVNKVKEHQEIQYFSDMPDKLYSASDLTITYKSHDLPSGKRYIAKCLEFERMGIGESEEKALASLLNAINHKRKMYEFKQKIQALQKQIDIQSKAYSKHWDVIGLITIPGWEKTRQIAVLDDMVMTVIWGCYGTCSICQDRCDAISARLEGKPAMMVRMGQFVLAYDKPADVEPLDYLNKILGVKAQFRIRY